MILNFSDSRYFELACRLASQKEKGWKLDPEDAFLLLVKDASMKQLSNLIRKISEKLPQYTDEEIYRILQGDASEEIDRMNKPARSILLACAYECLENGIPLGNETINDGKINTSDWMNHSLWEGKQCGLLAEKVGADKNRAIVAGILHDFGRKEIHTIEHVIRGFERLTDLGYETEAIGCLTHSFLNGGRCASNETAEEGFYVSAQGHPEWAENVCKDQMTLFLEKYEYTIYDRILNLADLMATSYGIVSPDIRIKDIAKRRTIDERNRGYFLAELINHINDMAVKMDLPHADAEYERITFDQDKTIPEMMRLLEKTSEWFFPEAAAER